MFLANGSSLEEAVRAGVKAGTFAVTSPGTQSSCPTLTDLRSNDALEAPPMLGRSTTEPLRDERIPAYCDSNAPQKIDAEDHPQTRPVYGFQRLPRWMTVGIHAKSLRGQAELVRTAEMSIGPRVKSLFTVKV